MKQKVKEVRRGAEGISPEGTPHSQVAEKKGNRKKKDMIWLLWVTTGMHK